MSIGKILHGWKWNQIKGLNGKIHTTPKGRIAPRSKVGSLVAPYQPLSGQQFPGTFERIYMEFQSWVGRVNRANGLRAWRFYAHLTRSFG